MSLADALRKVGIGKQKIIAGGIYTLKDDLIVIPDGVENRTTHDFRIVLVLSSPPVCNSYNCPCVTICPLSTKTHIKAETDIVIKRSQTNGLDRDSRLMLAYVQPVLKPDLDKHIGTISDDDWEMVMEQIVWNFDGQ
jgi:mRNA interferase MazF